jgi:hypothetical protein
MNDIFPSFPPSIEVTGAASALATNVSGVFGKIKKWRYE